MNASVEYAASGQPTLSHNAGEKQLTAKHLKPRAKILVVDDEPDVVKAVSMRLMSAGYEVVVASDGAAATKAAITAKPDLILLDIGMPLGDGHTVARRLTDQVNTLFVPVIFLTARSSQIDRDRAQDIGAADYITKPFTTKRLLTSIERVLRGPRTNDSELSY